MLHILDAWRKIASIFKATLSTMECCMYLDRECVAFVSVTIQNRYGVRLFTVIRPIFVKISELAHIAVSLSVWIHQGRIQSIRNEWESELKFLRETVLQSPYRHSRCPPLYLQCWVTHFYIYNFTQRNKKLSNKLMNHTKFKIFLYFRYLFMKCSLK